MNVALVMRRMDRRVGKDAVLFDDAAHECRQQFLALRVGQLVRQAD